MWGQKIKLYLFSESSHVAYQIKADDAGSNMVANSLPTDTPSTWGLGQKVKLYLFLKVVMLHIKLKEIEHRAPWKQICCHYTHQWPLGWDQKFIFFLLKVVMLHIKLKWKKCRPTCKVTLWIYTHPWPLGSGLKVRCWNCADVGIFFFIKLSTKTCLTGVCYDLNNTEGVNGIYVLWFTCFFQITLRQGI